MLTVLQLSPQFSRSISRLHFLQALLSAQRGAEGFQYAHLQLGWKLCNFRSMPFKSSVTECAMIEAAQNCWDVMLCKKASLSNKDEQESRRRKSMTQNTDNVGKRTAWPCCIPLCNAHTFASKYLKANN
eukprot:1161901-Pelagomonas_calceolata.AAC.1